MCCGRSHLIAQALHLHDLILHELAQAGPPDRNTHTEVAQEEQSVRVQEVHGEGGAWHYDKRRESGAVKDAQLRLPWALAIMRCHWKPGREPGVRVLPFSGGATAAPAGCPDELGAEEGPGGDPGGSARSLARPLSSSTMLRAVSTLWRSGRNCPAVAAVRTGKRPHFVDPPSARGMPGGSGSWSGGAGLIHKGRHEELHSSTCLPNASSSGVRCLGWRPRGVRHWPFAL